MGTEEAPGVALTTVPAVVIGALAAKREDASKKIKQIRKKACFFKKLVLSNIKGEHLRTPLSQLHDYLLITSLMVLFTTLLLLLILIVAV